MKRIDDETRGAILQAYFGGGMTYKALAEQFGVSIPTVAKIIKAKDGIDLAEANRKHAEVMAQKREEHLAATTWMEHIKPLHDHKKALEELIAKREKEMDKARQEYRNFCATVEQLMKEEV